MIEPNLKHHVKTITNADVYNKKYIGINYGEENKGKKDFHLVYKSPKTGKIKVLARFKASSDKEANKMIDDWFNRRHH